MLIENFKGIGGQISMATGSAIAQRSRMLTMPSWGVGRGMSFFFMQHRDVPDEEAMTPHQ
jgi:hypothetical protein